MFEVYLNDAKRGYDESKLYFHNADHWAREHCSSYYSHDIQDVSDVSYYYDNIALYLFREEQDALMFRLKWA
jgi:hypothetical protein